MIEIATGVHPFSDSEGFLGLIKCIVTNPPPKLDGSFSDEFCTFIDKWLFFWASNINDFNKFYNLKKFVFSLSKNPDDRGSCAELLNEPFIQKYVENPNDHPLIERVITEVKKDVVEP